MKQTKRSHLKMALLAVASAALLTPVVQGQTLTPQLNDLILGFRAGSNPGQTANLEVDLGNVVQFYNAAPGSEIPLPALSTADLVATYGANWYTRSDLFWGAVGTAGRLTGFSSGAVSVATATLWATAPNCGPAWTRSSSTTQKSASSKVEPMITAGAPGTLFGATPTANSAVSAVINATLSGSWSIQDTGVAGTSFGFFNPTIDNFEGTNIVVSQLYEVQPGSGAGTYLGDLILRNTGLSFRKAAPTAAVCQNFTVQADTNCTGSVTVDDIDNGSTGLCLLLALDATGPFPIGTTNVTLTVTDSNGSNSICTASVTVQGGAPVIASHANISQCSPVVTYTAPTASGCNTPIGAVVCTPASGSSFANGATTVLCTATDAASKIGSNSFTVTISGSAPSIVGAAPVTQCSPVVSYTQPTATDCSGASVSVICLPASGSTFAIGATTVHCTATDSASRIGSNSFVVTVSSTPPTINCPAAIATNVASASDTTLVVTYSTPTATDCASAAANVVCSPASGSAFALGATTVHCTATDTAGRTNTCSFSVTVSGLGLGAINSAVDALTDPKMTTGRKHSVDGNLTRAQAYLNAYNLDPTKTSKLKQSCAQLKAFITKITIYKRLAIINATDADALLASANAAKTSNGCP